MLISTFAELDIAEHMGEGRLTAAEIASRSGCHPGAMYRFLRACAASGLLTQSGDTFSLTHMGMMMHRDHPQSLRDVVRLEAGESTVQKFGHMRSWMHLAETVRSGKKVRPRVRLPSLLDATDTGWSSFFSCNRT